MGSQSSFWSQVRKGTTAFSQAFTGKPKPREATYPSPDAENTTPRERTFLFGHGLTYPNSDHRSEVASFKNWVYIAAHAKAMQIAQATVNVGRARSDFVTKGNEAHDTPTSNEEKLPSHPLMRRFANPNPVDNQMTWLYRIGMSICLTGAAYVLEVKSKGFGLPLEYWVLPRYWFQPMLVNAGMPNGGWLVTPSTFGFGQLIANRFGTTFYIRREEVIQIGWPDPSNPAEFTSPLNACSDIIDVASQRMETLNTLLQNAMNPSMIFSILGQMPKAEKERMIADLKAYKSGPHNANSIMVLDNIEKYEKMGKVNEIDAATGIDQDREGVMGILGVPESAAGMGGEDGYSAISSKMSAFAEFQVQPLCSIMGKEFEGRARKQFNDPRLTVNFYARRIDDPILEQTWADKYLTGYEKGIFTLNQVLAVFDEPAVPDGDVRFDPNAQDAATDAGQPTNGDEFDLSVPGTEGQQATNDVGRPPNDDESPAFDLSVDLPGKKLTGLKQPDMQRATGNRYPQHTMNGKH